MRRDRVAIYVGGKLAASLQRHEAWAANGESVIIGREAWGGDPPKGDSPGLLVGCLDEIKIWTRPLSEAEIQAESAAISAPRRGSTSSVPRTVKIRGRVTYKGQPVCSGFVTFLDDLGHRPAAGNLQSDGTYELSTFTAGDGALSGQYKVLVLSLQNEPTPDKPSQPVVSAIPTKYGKPQTTPLTITIPAERGSPIELNFDLRD